MKSSLGVAYRDLFHHWDRNATVRRAPHRALAVADEVGYFFSTDREPLVKEPEIIQLGMSAIKSLLIHRLYSYLHFTSFLERRVVNPVVLAIADGELGFHLPHQMRADADKIYTDEGWHAQFSNDLSRQVESVTQIVPVTPRIPEFYPELCQIAQGCRHPAVAHLMFAIVSETLISAILRDLPNDQSVVQAVRDEIGDHAKDELLHHQFFSDVLRHVWPQLSDCIRSEYGCIIPKMIRLFLRPDVETMGSALAGLGIEGSVVTEILQRVHHGAAAKTHSRSAARNTVALFQEVGALSDARVLEAFAQAELLE
jgi:P-aminobenzoate N-oxygenase AurF